MTKDHTHELLKLLTPASGQELDALFTEIVGEAESVEPLTSEKPLFFRAAETRAAALEMTVDQLLGDYTARLKESKYPTLDCLYPDEVQRVSEGTTLSDDQRQHVCSCEPCRTLLAAASPSPARREALMNDVQMTPDIRAVAEDRDALSKVAASPAPRVRFGFVQLLFSLPPWPSLAAVVAVVGIVAIAIPPLLRSRVSATEAATIGDIRTLASSQAAFRDEHGRYAASIDELQRAGLINPSLDALLKKTIALETTQRPGGRSGYFAVLVPGNQSLSLTSRASASYYFDETGAIRKAVGRTAGPADPVVARVVVPVPSNGS